MRNGWCQGSGREVPLPQIDCDPRYLIPQHDEFRSLFGGFDLVRVCGANSDHIAACGVAPLRQNGAADYTFLWILASSMKRFPTEHPNLVNHRVPPTIRIRKFARDNWRLMIHDELSDLDPEL